MKIKTIKIKGYKAFFKDYEFNVDGKNLFIYGENGSGKSSFYYALKDFFQSSIETLDFDEVENVFLTQEQKGKGYVKVIFNPDKNGVKIDKPYTFKRGGQDTYVTGDTSIRDAISLKSFLTYKHLLGIHHINNGEEIDLFELLVNGVLKHFKSVAVTGGIELGELWKRVGEAVAKPLTGQRYNRAQKSKDVISTLKDFNTSFSKLFQPGGIENILKYAKPILDKFGHNIEIGLNYTQAVPSSDLESIERNHVRIKVKYLGKEVDKPHLFLNEARLSAIAISIYLGMIKRHIQGMPCKILFLDDIFIGLDISNRLPLLKILDEEFKQYQIFITTYDKPWYEFVKTTYLNNNDSWKSYEFYARRARKGFEIPVIREIRGPKDNSHIDYYIKQAENYYDSGDNKAAGVYLRSAYEFILKRFCYNRVPVKYVTDTSKLQSEDLWNAVKIYKKDKPTKCDLTGPTKNKIDHFVKLTLNSLSHHDVNKYEISTEIQAAIQTIKDLKAELGV